ncbi:ImmA/IrrE family metallo-endopeptidase [Staphylococcus hominis]|uniref:ImmA/IrrE family metallo-endopeptidase n=1 Tax=Staphylococcus hominis TaxID=1290 RepID=UPI00287A3F96|nr:ImmA/IrrE family metallo-endopeptidase [Staphylococcus hominis]MDS3871833.1 ImmA/IrrE family metallo-endopeptidase [Staphylococcus hominis]
MTIQKLIKETVDRIYSAFEIPRHQPINLDEFLNTLNIQLHESEELIYEGKIEKDYNDNTIITIKYNHNEGRRRFTIAHELGHYFLHFNDEDKEFKDSVFYRSLEYNDEEIEANEFAANLLMPEEEYKVFAENNAYNQESNTYDIEKIAEYFIVSRQAAIYRGKNLNVFR